jgi:uncharacterized protein YdeI (YjbR/CyaY-like superfamily)
MKITSTLYVTNREDWRAWLKVHHRSATEVWLIYYKKESGRPRIGYDEAVEEALCFGWIDSTVKRIDEEKFAQRFTPRKDDSNWSESNRKRLRELIKKRRMTKAGLLKISDAVLQAMGDSELKPKSKEVVIPPYFEEALKVNQKASAYFNSLAPSYRRNYVEWITTARKEETRERRVREAIRLLALKKKLGMK